MKNTFKKVAAVVLAVLMCVSAMVPTFAASTCPGKGTAHTTATCSYTLIDPVAASCLSGGAEMAKCNVCGDSFVVKTTPALGHEWKMPTVTCTGTNPVKVCTRANCDVLAATRLPATEAVTPTDHAWGAWALSGVSVCTPGERVVRTCTLCPAEEIKYISNEGHYFELASYIAPASCNVEGLAKYLCVVKGCGATKEMKIEPTTTAHTYVSWADYYDGIVPAPQDPNAKAPTCAAAGSQTVVCKDCARTAVIVVPQLTTHAWNTTTPMKANEPTCDKTGNYVYYRCTYCLINGFNYEVLEKEGENKYADEIVPIDEEKFEKFVVIPSYHENYKVLAEELPTCDDDGARIVACGNPDATKACNWTETRVLASFGGHLYYPDVTDVEKQEAIKEALGIDKSVKWSSLDDFGKPAAGQNKVTATGDKAKIWETYTPANCEEDAVVVWKCLNCAKAELAGNANYTCTETKEATPEGLDFVKFGHDYPVKPNSNTADCVTPGIKTFICKICGDDKTQTSAALGHWLVVDKDNSKDADCKEDGKIVYKCANGCGKYDPTEDEEVVVKTAADHKYEYYEGKNPSGKEIWNSWKNYNGTKPSCLTSAKVTRRCAYADCPAHVPAEVELPATGHTYLDTKDATVVEKLAQLKFGDKLVKDADGIIDIELAATTTPATSIVVAECTKIGGCEGGAEYKIICESKKDGCVFFETFKIEEGFGGGHNKVYINATATAATTTAPGYSNSWYCKNSYCVNFFKTYEEAVADMKSNTDATHEVGKDIVSAKLHQAWDAEDKVDNSKEVTYKDVPYAAIKDAKTDAKAQDVEAPVDAKGNVTRYVAVPGTSLIWLFKYEADNHAEYSVTKGGFICTCRECAIADNDNTNECTVTPKAVFEKGAHTYVADTTVGTNGTVVPTCKTHGYTVMTCSDPDCFAAYQTGFKPVGEHVYTKKVDINATCVLPGYEVYECDVCKDVKYVTEYAKGHKNSDGKALDAICDGDRETNRFCVGCQTTIAKTVHDGTPGTKCTKCTQIIPTK